MLNIKHLRQQRNLTQTELADLIGVSLRTIQNWEAGKKNITVDKLERLKKELRITTNQSAYFEPKKTPLIKDGVEFDLKECAEYVANNLEEARKLSKLLDLTIQNDNRDYLIYYLTSKGFIVKE